MEITELFEIQRKDGLKFMRRELQPLLDLTPSLLQFLNASLVSRNIFTRISFMHVSFDCSIRSFFEEFSENNFFNASSISNDLHYVKNNRNGCVIRIYTTRKYWTDGDSTGLKVTITLLTKNVHETNKNSSLNKFTRL